MNKKPQGGRQPIPRIEALRVKRYRALHDLDLRGMTPLTVFLGPNGSGKSTIFDVFAFLAECFSAGLRKAWDRRGRFKELRTRGTQGPIEIELKYREAPSKPVITYHLAIDEGPKGPFVYEEWLKWKRGSYGAPFRFLDFHNGEGRVVSGEVPDEQDERMEERLSSPETIAVNTRDEKGYTQARRAADMRGIPDFLREGGLLGNLWLEGQFEVGDPLTRSGGPKANAASSR